jgi:hypothetical protein
MMFTTVHTPTSDAAHAAYQILVHPIAPLFDAATAERLERIRNRKRRDASPAEWAILRNCQRVILRAERGAA